MKTKTLTILGDTLTVRYDGTLWVAPCCGRGFARAADAMRREVEFYLVESGETPTDEELDGYVDQMVDGR